MFPSHRFAELPQRGSLYKPPLFGEVSRLAVTERVFFAKKITPKCSSALYPFHEHGDSGGFVTVARTEGLGLHHGIMPSFLTCLGYGKSPYAIGLYLNFLNSESSDLCFGKALLVVRPRALPVRWLPPTNETVKSKNFLSDPFFLCGIFYYKGLVKFLTVHWTDLLWILGRLSLGVFAALTCTWECPPSLNWECAKPSSLRGMDYRPSRIGHRR